MSQVLETILWGVGGIAVGLLIVFLVAIAIDVFQHMRGTSQDIGISSGLPPRPASRMAWPRLGQASRARLAEYPTLVQGATGGETRRARLRVQKDPTAMAIYRSILAAPEDKVPRAALSDWLRERGFEGAADRMNPFKAPREDQT